MKNNIWIEKHPFYTTAIFLLIIYILFAFVMTMEGKKTGGAGDEIIPENLKLKTTVDKILDSKTETVCTQKSLDASTTATKAQKITAPCLSLMDVKSYDYIDSVKVTNKEFLFQNDIDFSNAEIKRKEGDCKTKGNKCWVRVSAQTFYADGKGDVYEVKNATTTIDAFDKQTKITYLDKFLNSFKPNIALAFSTYDIATADGYVSYDAGATYATAHDAADGNTVYDTQPGTLYHGQGKTGGKYYIYRTALPFNTSAIGAGATVSSSTLYIRGTQNDGGVGSVDLVSIDAMVDTTATMPNVADYNNFGTTLMSDTEFAITGWSNAWKRWLLNAGGRANINVTGVSLFGMRNNQDISNTAPSVWASFVYWYTSMQSDSALHPYLDVEFTAGGGGIPAPRRNNIIINEE